MFACGRARSLRDYRKLLERGGTWDDALALARSINPALDTDRPARATENGQGHL